jgi:hypothetical protein
MERTYDRATFHDELGAGGLVELEVDEVVLDVELELGVGEFVLDVDEGGGAGEDEEVYGWGVDEGVGVVLPTAVLPTDVLPTDVESMVDVDVCVNAVVALDVAEGAAEVEAEDCGMLKGKGLGTPQ